ncbi:MAG: FIST C-terminal domain-containing protein [Hyphomicrobiales bacterium]|nr:FIST C-terminal domain-containing protein [Hyphomicrobiales bacterium]
MLFNDRTRTDDGISVASSSRAHATDAVAELSRQLGDRPLVLVLVFFSPNYDARELAPALEAAFAPVPVVGCSTAGEITPDGITDGSIVALGFAARDFVAVAQPLPGLSTLGMQAGQDAAASAVAKMMARAPDSALENTFALLLVDGLSNREEKLVSSLSGGLGTIPLIGGSAGDAYRFRSTQIIRDGKAESDAAILVLIHSRCPFTLFNCDHFDPTGIKLVVTEADVDRRIVKELNAAPAAAEYAAAIGLRDQPLSPMSFAAHPVVVCVGGDYYVRSIQKVNDDGSLSFMCAIDEGIVLTLAKANDMTGRIEKSLMDIRTMIGEPQVIIGFECVLRRIESELYQINHQLGSIYQRHRVIGFHTYGEQFNAMHLNQTFSGIALGR